MELKTGKFDRQAADIDRAILMEELERLEALIAAMGGGGGGAPTTADYLVRTADAGLSAELVVTDTATVTWDWGTAGQAKANAAAAGAPTTADFLVRTADPGLSAERVVTDTATVTWDWGTAGQAKANAVIPAAPTVLSDFLLMGG